MLSSNQKAQLELFRSRLMLDACAAQSFLRVVFLAVPLPPPFFLPPFGFVAVFAVFGGVSSVGDGAGAGVMLPICPLVELVAADSGLSFCFLIGGATASVSTKPAAPFKSVVNFGVIWLQYFNSFVALSNLSSSSGLNNVWEQAKMSTSL